MKRSKREVIVSREENVILAMARIEGMQQRRRHVRVSAIIWTLRLSSVAMSSVSAVTILDQPWIQQGYGQLSSISSVGLIAPLFIALVIIWLPRFGRSYSENPLALIGPIFAWMAMLGVTLFVIF